MPSPQTIKSWESLPTEDRSLPLYQRVTEAIQREIATGRLPIGSMLPPEIELAQRFGVSRHTMRMGIAALVRAGALERQRGKGSVVTRPPLEQSLSKFYSVAAEMRARGATLATQVLARGHFTDANELSMAACDALCSDTPDQIGYLHRLRLVDGEPLLLEWLTFPAALAPSLLEAPVIGGGDPGAAPFYETLAAQARLTVTQAHETLKPEIASEEVARLLQISVGTPLFLVERTSFAGDQRVEWRRTYVRGDRITYAVDLVNPTADDAG